mmetsp:Transcript_168013/g.534468  ORF Transcript_168013/g.534468 Transcript_168013/m.534468 type:complete len:292 (-) Transcript_168013:17-892(-)
MKALVELPLERSALLQQDVIHNGGDRIAVQAATEAGVFRKQLLKTTPNTSLQLLQARVDAPAVLLRDVAGGRPSVLQLLQPGVDLPAQAANRLVGRSLQHLADSSDILLLLALHPPAGALDAGLEFLLTPLLEAIREGAELAEHLQFLFVTNRRVRPTCLADTGGGEASVHGRSRLPRRVRQLALRRRERAGGERPPRRRRAGARRASGAPTVAGAAGGAQCAGGGGKVAAADVGLQQQGFRGRGVEPSLSHLPCRQKPEASGTFGYRPGGLRWLLHALPPAHTTLPKPET